MRLSLAGVMAGLAVFLAGLLGAIFVPPMTVSAAEVLIVGATLSTETVSCVVAVRPVALCTSRVGV